MGGSGGGDSTTTAEPWEAQQPYLEDIFRQAQNIYRQGYGQEYYPGQTVAGMAPATQAGIGMLEQSAYGAPEQGAMQNYLMGGMMNPYGQAGVGSEFGGVTPFGGGYGESTPMGGVASPAQQQFSGNPYLDQMFNTAAGRAGEAFQEQTMPAIGAMFGSAGRTGSGIQQEVAENAAQGFGRDLQGMAANIYGPAYESAMGRDVQRRQLGAEIGRGAAALTPSMQNMQQQNIQNMLMAGQIPQNYAQQLIDADRQRFDFYQQAPYQALGQYGNIVQGMPGGYGTTMTEGPDRNRVMGGAGGAMSGIGLGQALGATALGPWALGGAVLGGLL